MGRYVYSIWLLVYIYILNYNWGECSDEGGRGHARADTRRLLYTSCNDVCGGERAPSGGAAHGRGDRAAAAAAAKIMRW